MELNWKNSPPLSQIALFFSGVLVSSFTFWWFVMPWDTLKETSRHERAELKCSEQIGFFPQEKWRKHWKLTDTGSVLCNNYVKSQSWWMIKVSICSLRRYLTSLLCVSVWVCVSNYCGIITISVSEHLYCQLYSKKKETSVWKLPYCKSTK